MCCAALWPRDKSPKNQDGKISVNPWTLGFFRSEKLFLGSWPCSTSLGCGSWPPDISPLPSTSRIQTHMSNVGEFPSLSQDTRSRLPNFHLVAILRRRGAIVQVQRQGGEPSGTAVGALSLDSLNVPPQNQKPTTATPRGRTLSAGKPDVAVFGGNRNTFRSRKRRCGLGTIHRRSETRGNFIVLNDGHHLARSASWRAVCSSFGEERAW
jgi:hypothetical protein